MYGIIPEFSFLSHRGDTVSSAALKGKIYIADFIFTSCPGICPKMTLQMSRIQEKFRENPDVRILSITVDPERDTREALQEYARVHNINGDQWYFATGEKKEIYKIAREGFKISAGEGDGGGGDFIHSEKFVLVDSKGEIRGYYNGTDSTDVEKLMGDMERLFGQKN